MKTERKPLSPQAQRILGELKFQYKSCSLWRMSSRTGYPEASIRRALQELRKSGRDVSLSYGVIWLYGA